MTTQAEKDAISAMFQTSDGVPLKMEEHKPKLSLLPRKGLEELAKVYEFGLTKYSRDSWREFTPEQAKACLPDAALRHLMAYCDGEEIDVATGLPHLMQVVWNCMTLQIITHPE